MGIIQYCFVFYFYYSRLKDKYEQEIRELEMTEKLTRDRFNETRNKLAECEATIQNNQALIKQHELELNHSKKVIKISSSEETNVV